MRLSFCGGAGEKCVGALTAPRRCRYGRPAIPADICPIPSGRATFHAESSDLARPSRAGRRARHLQLLRRRGRAVPPAAAGMARPRRTRDGCAAAARPARAALPRRHRALRRRRHRLHRLRDGYAADRAHHRPHLARQRAQLRLPHLPVGRHRDPVGAARQAHRRRRGRRHPRARYGPARAHDPPRLPRHHPLRVRPGAGGPAGRPGHHPWPGDRRRRADRPAHHRAVRGLAGRIRHMPAAEAGFHLRAIVRLLAEAYGRQAGLLGNARAVERAQMYGQVLRHIRHHLHEAELSPDSVLDALGLARPSVYRLFQHEGGLARYIQRLRLRLAAHELVAFPQIPVRTSPTPAASRPRRTSRARSAAPTNDAAGAAHAGRPILTRMPGTALGPRRRAVMENVPGCVLIAVIAPPLLPRGRPTRRHRPWPLAAARRCCRP